MILTLIRRKLKSKTSLYHRFFFKCALCFAFLDKISTIIENLFSGERLVRIRVSMNKWFVGVLVFVTSCLVLAQEKSAVVLDQPVTLSGQLILAKTVSALNEKSIIRYPAIKLNNPIYIEEEGSKAVSLIQLAMTGKQQLKDFDKLKGKKVTVRCKELYEWDNAHHHTPVLCLVEKLSTK